jgi:hypothetical protein
MTPFSLSTQPRNIQDTPIILNMVYGGESFTVSMVNQTCSCEKFAASGSNPMNHMSRWCEHLMYAMHTRKALAHENEWIQAIAADQHQGPLFAMMIERPTTGKVLMTGRDDGEWLNFYAKSKKRGETVTQASGKINRYGWSIKRKGWAYDKAPPGARELRVLINDHDGTYTAQSASFK